MPRPRSPTRRSAAPPAAFALVLLATALSGCSDDRSFEPLAPGHWWIYAIDARVLDEPRHSRYVARNAASGELDRLTVVARRAQASSVDYLHRGKDGVTRRAYRRGPNGTLSFDQPPRVLLPADPVPGKRWSVPSTLALIESRTFARADRVIVRRYPVTLEKTVSADDATIEVPAGLFHDCLLVTGQGRTSVRTDRGNASASVTVTTREWYAPGVGLVRLEREETSTSPFLKNGRQTWTLLEHGD